jgi:hypothetical protein
MRIRLLVVTAAATAFVPLAGCGTGGAEDGGGGQEDSRAEVIGSWQKEFCTTVQVESAAERMSYAEYRVGPAYLPMGDAMTPNTFDCHADFSIKDAEEKNQQSGYVMISVYNRNDSNYPTVEEYFTTQVAEFRDFYEGMEDGLERTAREEYDALAPIIDEQLTGPWQEGIAYATPSAGSYQGAAFAAVRAKGYALFVTVNYPMDPEVSQLLRYAMGYEKDGEPLPDHLTDEAIEARRILPFTDAEIAEWTTTEYIKAAYGSIEAKLDAQ